MSDRVTFKIDGREVSAVPESTIMDAADAAGIYIPRLCALKGLVPHGSCRLCTVMVNGRPQAACTQPVAAGAEVENDTPALNDLRRHLIEMLLAEGNHVCPACERSGSCELQALAYRLGVVAPRHPFQFPKREVDASHRDYYVDRNRCILCGRCVRTSCEIDRKGVFDFTGRGSHKQLAVDAAAGLGATTAAATDRIAEVCPVGAIIRKRTAFRTPVGQRPYDRTPIGTDIETAARK